MRPSRKEKMSPNEKALCEGIIIYDDFMSNFTEVIFRLGLSKKFVPWLCRRSPGMWNWDIGLMHTLRLSPNAGHTPDQADGKGSSRRSCGVLRCRGL